MDSYSIFLLIIISLIFSAFFSGMEIAFVSANKLKVEVDKKSGGFAARLLSKFTKDESRFISTMLVGNNIALVIYGIAFANLVLEIFPAGIYSEGVTLIIQTVISSIIILIFAEFIPKALIRINPNNTLNLFAIPVHLFYYHLYPIILVTIKAGEFILIKLFGVNISKDSKAFDIVDIDNYIKEFGEVNFQQQQPSHEIQIFRNAIEFPTTKLRECMIPRTEIVAVEEKDDMQTVRARMHETGLSKVITYKDNIDNITGYIHAFDFFKNPTRLDSIIRPIMLVPETMHANKLLKSFIQQRKSIAIVVDEFGGTSGLITIEDVMEEIFGEIDDEYDVDNMIEKSISENEFVFSARLEIDFLNEKYNLNLPESEEYETLGGLIVNYYESIPEKNQEIEIDGLLLKVLQVSETRVEQVLIKITDKQ